MQRPDLCFLLYTRTAACPLCDEAWDLLLRYQKNYGHSKLQSKDDRTNRRTLICEFTATAFPSSRSTA